MAGRPDLFTSLYLDWETRLVARQLGTGLRGAELHAGVSERWLRPTVFPVLFLPGNKTRQLAHLRADAVSCSAAVAACVGISATEVLLSLCCRPGFQLAFL